MSVYFHKARKQWYYDFFIEGRRYSNSCDDPVTGKHARNKTEAKVIETRVRSNIFAGLTLRPTHANYTAAQAFAFYMAQYPENSHSDNLKNYVSELITWFGGSSPLITITTQRVLEYIAWARKQKIYLWTGGRIRPGGPFPDGRNADDYWKDSGRLRSDSTINRYLSSLGKTLRLANNNYDPVTGLPLLPIMPKVPKLKEPELLPRPIAPEDLERILAIAPQHLADAIRLTVLMGFRRTEVFSLTLRHFDRHNRGIWLSHAETKGKRDEFIPANNMAYDILCRLADRAVELGQKHLILYRTGGKKVKEKWRPIKNPQTAWENTLSRLGLTGHHVFHNTKATFVTAVAQTMPAAVVQDLARHKDFETTMRYIRVADSVRRKAVESVTGQLFFKVPEPLLLKSPSPKPQSEVNEEVDFGDKSLISLVGMAGFEPTTPSPPD